MGILKCGISKKRLIVERNGQKFGTRGTTVDIYMEGTFDARFLEFGLGSFGALCKISDSMISKHYSFNSFCQISTKLHTKYYNQGLI